jgi:hypothetical protein
MVLLQATERLQTRMDAVRPAGDRGRLQVDTMNAAVSEDHT